MRMILLLAVIATQALFPVAEAKKRVREITVTAAPTVPVWAAKLSRKLEDSMRYPTGYFQADPLRGFVRVRFSMNADGSLTGMQLVRKSGSRLLDNAALYAVSKLDRVSIMPTSIAAGRLIEAHLLFAQNPEQLRDVEAANRAYHEIPSNQVASAGEKPLLLASLARAPVDVSH